MVPDRNTDRSFSGSKHWAPEAIFEIEIFSCPVIKRAPDHVSIKVSIDLSFDI